MPAFPRRSQNFNFAIDDYLDPALTFSRPSSATRINKQTGLLELVGPDVPRLERDGLLIEAASTNLIAWSNDPRYWTNSGFSLVQGINPPFAEDHQAWEATATVAGAYFINPQALSPNTKYTLSVWLRGFGANYAPANMIFPIRIVCNGGGAITECQLNGSAAWKRFTVTLDTTGIDTTGGHITIGFAGNHASGQIVNIWGAQLEQSPVATSYIPTVGAPVTRAADLCFLDPDNNGSQPWWNPANYTIIAEALWKTLDAGFAFDFPLASGVPGAGFGRNNGAMNISNGAYNLIVECQTLRAKIGVIQNATGCFFSLNGATAVRFGEANATEKIGRLSIGQHRYGILPLNGHIRTLTILPHDVSAPVLAAMSA